jgi:hypothetical protein
MTLEAIADLYGVTRERVRQMEAKALRSMVKRMRLLGVKGHQPTEVEDIVAAFQRKIG